ncbi:hypothetical protein DSM100238_1299 [Bifidobacterium apri]|uniref:Uncharacterized protein n=1 Tax=Bifidobacterium apri TaxID=1769423 RepID=A0A6A2V7K1_9BIFI|nr:hypothetical protein DSM100238_1299 [Bifidobacterium apri]
MPNHKPSVSADTHGALSVGRNRKHNPLPTLTWGSASIQPFTDAHWVLNVGKSFHRHSPTPQRRQKRGSATDEVRLVAAREIQHRAGKLDLMTESRIIRKHLFGTGTRIRNHVRILDHAQQLQS